MGNSVQSILNIGSEGLIIETECYISNSLPGIIIVGLGGKAVDEAKERIRGAFASSKLDIPVNLAPADVPKEGSSLDPAIATAILAGSGRIAEPFSKKDALIGELGLDGTIRPVRGVIGKLLAGKRNGIERFFIPAQNLQQARLVPAINLVPIQNLREIYLGLNGQSTLVTHSTGSLPTLPLPDVQAIFSEYRLSDVVGQERAKRAIEIAAAGGHNILLNGPPGTGKSMLAKSLVSLLPKLTQKEILEITHLHSLSNNNYDQLITTRPFRAPHHSASHTAIVGGGHTLRPGEISLSHRGVLFFDEFPEFSRTTIEALRQPLEDRTITISRIKDSTSYPADFIFVATANPCPCGYYGTSKPCHCSPHQILRYRQKLSGPIMDRIDLYANVDQVEYDRLLKTGNERRSNSDEKIIHKIALAREKQSQRHGSSGKLNAEMNNDDINQKARLDHNAKSVLNEAAKSMDISARSYMRIIKVARTIADLELSDNILINHVTEALQYRKPTHDVIS